MFLVRYVARRLKFLQQWIPEFIEELRNTSNIFQQWAKTRVENGQLESYEVPELNEVLDNFALYLINK